MKKRHLLLLMALAAMTAGAQSKFDLESRNAYMRIRTELSEQAANKGVSLKSMESERQLRLIVKMKDGAEAKDLEGMGFQVDMSHGEFGVVTVPFSKIADLDAVAELQTMRISKKVNKKLRTANGLTGVDKVHSGEGLDAPYSGEGVIVGVCDMGFEPNHAMFLDESGKTRVRSIYTSKRDYTDADHIANYSTDSRTDYHGTHVTGIAAGHFSNGDDLEISGVATKSDILMGAVVYEADIMSNVEKMVAYAKEANKPLVINMSLGTNEGPHDDSDAFTQYINKIISEDNVTVCIAAGNEGQDPIAQKKTFAEGDTEMSGVFKGLLEDYGYGLQTTFSVWSDDETPFDLDVVILNSVTGEVTKTLGTFSGSQSQTFTTKTSETTEGVTYDSDLAKFFYGTIEVSSGLQASHNRYGASYDIMGQRLNGNYTLGYIVRGKAGQSVAAYGDEYTYLQKIGTGGVMTDADGVSPNGTINNMASGMDAIVVASYNTVSSGKYVDYSTYSLASYGENNAVGDVSSFTSWGELYDGTQLPDIATPGAFVESAMSTPFMNYSQNSAYEKKVTTKCAVNGKTYYWTVNLGTSMATPYVTGVAAVWLSADNTLTNADIKEIAKKTAQKDEYVKNTKYPMQFGAGKIDAYEGLKEVLDRKTTALKEIPAGKDMMVRYYNDNNGEVYIAGLSSIELSICDLNGKVVRTFANEGNTVKFATSGLGKGVYVLSAYGDNKRYTRKVVVK